jgi:hypothetical protein
VGYKKFVSEDDKRRALLDKRKQAAVSTVLGQALKSDKVGTLKQVRNTSNQELFGIKPGETGFASTKQITSAPGVFAPIDNRMAFTFDADTNTLSQTPVSKIDAMNKNKRNAQEIVGAVINTSEKLDNYLEGKGVTKGAANFAKMKGSVINLAYLLAKIKEPGNPKLSEGDIIRQLDRLKFGSSKDVFAATLNNVFDDEVIGARGQITGYGLDPDDFFGTGTKKSTEEGKGSGESGSQTKDNDPFNIR